MAINKRKILQSAQKHLQKGALERALKDYKTVLEADPKDANVRLKIGDILLRQGRAPDAVASYLKVAQQFMSEGFDAKAVALYKQITKIDPKRHEVQLPLAELYQRLGLSSDAMRALQTVADAHYREGDKRAALDVLRKMAGLDPTNAINRLKVAELLRQEGLQSEALAEYRECVAELERQGDVEGRLGALRKLLELDPGASDERIALGEAYLEQQKWSKAEEVARALMEADARAAVEGCRILAEAYRGLRRDDALPEIYRQMAEALRARGDEDAARQILQRYVPSDGISLDAPTHTEAEADDTPVLDGDDDDDDLVLDGALHADVVPAGREPLLEPAAFPDAGALDPQGAAQPAPPEGDVEQLFAEVSVYLRYGKHDRALACLRAIEAKSPGEPAVLSALAEGFQSCGASQRAIEILSRAIESARGQGDASAADTLLRRLAGLDAAAAAALGRQTPAAPIGSPDDIDSMEFEIGDDFALDEPEPLAGGAGGRAEGGAAQPEKRSDREDARADATAPAGSVEFEFDFRDDEAPAGVEAGQGAEPAFEDDDFGDDVLDVDELPTSFAASGEGAHAAEITLPDPLEPFDLDAAGPEALEPFEPDSAAPRPAVAPAGPAADSLAASQPFELDELTPPAGAPGAGAVVDRIAEQLDEASFYMQQGLHDEAASVCRAILELAPNHPQALLRLGEIEAARAAEAEAIDAPGLETAGVETEEPGLLEAEPEALDSDALEPASVAQRDAASAAASAVVEAGEAGDFDLAKELCGAFHEGAAPPERFAASGSEREGFEEVFAAFKYGVEQQLGHEDYEARYDLGIAYREMGLLDDAVKEFQTALEGPSRKLDCLHMMGLCALDLGRPADAVGHFEQALALPEVPEEQQTALRFELGLAYEAQGEAARARECFESVAALDPEFRGVTARLAAGSGGTDVEGDEEAGFESFDDLVSDSDEVDEDGDDEADAAESAESAEADDYESFEDLMAAAESDDEAPGDVELLEAAPSVLSGPESEREPHAPLEAELLPSEVPEAASEAAASVAPAAPEPCFADVEELEAELADEDFEPALPESEPDAEPAAAEPEGAALAEPQPTADDPQTQPERPSGRKGRRKKISFV